MNKDIYVVTWPDGTISILNAANKKELFEKMDKEGDPVDAKVKIQRVKMNEDFHLTASVQITRNLDFKVSVHALGDDDEELVSVKFPKNITNQLYEV